MAMRRECVLSFFFCFMINSKPNSKYMLRDIEPYRTRGFVSSTFERISRCLYFGTKLMYVLTTGFDATRHLDPHDSSTSAFCAPSLPRSSVVLLVTLSVIALACAEHGV